MAALGAHAEAHIHYLVLLAGLECYFRHIAHFVHWISPEGSQPLRS